MQNCTLTFYGLDFVLFLAWGVPPPFWGTVHHVVAFAFSYGSKGTAPTESYGTALLLILWVIHITNVTPPFFSCIVGGSPHNQNIHISTYLITWVIPKACFFNSCLVLTNWITCAWGVYAFVGSPFHSPFFTRNLLLQYCPPPPNCFIQQFCFLVW